MGIVADAARKPMSHELTGMRARVRCLDGKISIDGKPGDGILSRVELPALNLGRARASQSRFRDFSHIPPDRDAAAF